MIASYLFLALTGEETEVGKELSHTNLMTMIRGVGQGQKLSHIRKSWRDRLVAEIYLELDIIFYF